MKFILFIRQYFALLVVVAVYGWSAGAILLYRNRETPPNATVIRIGHWQLEASDRVADSRSALREPASIPMWRWISCCFSPPKNKTRI